MATLNKEMTMSPSLRNQLVSAFAAVVCAVITIGISIAPAVAPASGLVA
jgi:hypothetical protein